MQELSPYTEYNLEDWSRYRADTPLTLDENDLGRLQGINERVSMEEVEKFYLPLGRLLSLYVAATQDLYRATATFLDKSAAKVPYVIGLGGSVAVGKSTTARILQALLARWPDHPKVDLVTTDGFLLSNAILAERGLMNRKGFPESYDQRRLLEFVSRLKAGDLRVSSPVYSHLTYDTVAGEETVIAQPNIVIIEGLNVLQAGGGGTDLILSDMFDFKIYVDARREHIREWYVDRFLTLRGTSFRDPTSYFRRYADLSDEEARTTALNIWQEINEVNLVENIEPTRGRADLVLFKGCDHAVERVFLRKI